MVNLKKFNKINIACLLSVISLPLLAQKSGDFDYYILALSWNSGWCDIEGNSKNAPQCHDQKKHGFALHGLWPQYEKGWPQFCSTSKPNPSRSQTSRQANLYGSSGAAWHQWNKHGRCTGLDFGSYYDLSKELFEKYRAPEVFMQIDEILKIDPDVIEDAISETYPSLGDENMAVICKNGVFQEVRICLNKDLEPTKCLGNAARDCDYSPEFIPSY